MALSTPDLDGVNVEVPPYEEDPDEAYLGPTFAEEEEFYEDEYEGDGTLSNPQLITQIVSGYTHTGRSTSLTTLVTDPVQIKMATLPTETPGKATS